jgi:uncharacterized phage protein (TIGR02216 family)
MHAGLGLLRLDPNAFWRMTPREFAAACGALAPTRPRLRRRDLERLMRLYPDGEVI